MLAACGGFRMRATVTYRSFLHSNSKADPMRVLTPVQALSAAAAFALIVGCSGRSAIAPNPSIPMTMGSRFAPVGEMAQPDAIIADVPLGSDARYAVLAGSTITNSGPTIVTSSLGLSPG